MSEEFIECWHCNMPVTLAERGDNDGFCPHCMCELDLDDYLCQSVATINQLRAELAAIKAQEPVTLSDDVREYLQEGINSVTQCEDSDIDYDFANELAKLLDPLYAAPVSEAKAQGVVMIGRDAIREVFMRNGFTIKEGRADLKPYVYAAAEELLRLAAPVQQVSVPDDRVKFSRFLTDAMTAAGLLRHGKTDKGLASRISSASMEYMLAAAPAAPAADAGLVEALEMIIEMNRQHAADQFGDAEKAEAWSCIRVAREALAAHRAQGVV